MLAAPDGRRLVPVLTYHAVSDDPPEPIRRWSVSPARLRAHLSALRQAGFTGLTVTELLACYRGERTLPEKPVVLTFDDGYEDFLLEALPALDDSGFRSTLYASSGLLRDERVGGRTARPDARLAPARRGRAGRRRDRGAQPHPPRARHAVAPRGGLGGHALRAAATRRARPARRHLRLPLRLLEPARPRGGRGRGLRRRVRGEERLQPRRRRPVGAVADPRGARLRHGRADAAGHPARPAGRLAAGEAADRRLAHVPAGAGARDRGPRRGHARGVGRARPGRRARRRARPAAAVTGSAPAGGGAGPRARPPARDGPCGGAGLPGRGGDGAAGRRGREAPGRRRPEPDGPSRRASRPRNRRGRATAPRPRRAPPAS